MRTLGGRLDTKISIIMNVFHARLGGFSHFGLHVNVERMGDVRSEMGREWHI